MQFPHAYTMESLRRPTFPTKPLSFIRIILSNNVKSSRIILPETFTERNGEILQEKVILKVPNGDVWKVDVKKSKGEVWFSNGWVEFAKYYGLNYGNLLVFRYEGCSVFRVCMYEPSCCEIVYPKKMHVLGRTEVKGSGRLDSCKKVKVDNCKSTSSWDQDQDQVTKINIDDGDCSSKKVKRDERKRALEAAKDNFKSSKPFFMVQMLQSHIEGRSGVCIPKTFIKNNWSGFMEDQKCVLMFGSKTWETTTRVNALRVVGWKRFMKDNGVSVSDICAFELINNDKNLLKVSIIRDHL